MKWLSELEFGCHQCLDWHAVRGIISMKWRGSCWALQEHRILREIRESPWGERFSSTWNTWQRLQSFLYFIYLHGCEIFRADLDPKESHCGGSSRGCAVSVLGRVSRPDQVKSLGNLAWPESWPRFEQEVGLQTSWRPSQPELSADSEILECIFIHA